MSHARGKAEAAEGVAQKALEECRLARIAAKELSPSFHIYENGERAASASVSAFAALDTFLLLILASSVCFQGLNVRGRSKTPRTRTTR